nr:phosphomannomutase [uncultured Cohaesibacter sp.]
MPIRFGTSGLRGLAVELMGVASIIYTKAFCHHLEETGLARKGDTILIGQDLRESSPAIARNCIKAIRACGFKPVDCGLLPTPALACYAMFTRSAAVMVTGSHIPSERNGIKFYLPDGEIAKHDEISISCWAEKLEGSTGVDAAEAEDAHHLACEAFLNRMKALLPDAALTGMRIGVYQHSSVARDLLIDILRHYGAEVVALGRSSTFVPIDTEAVSEETVGLLKDWAGQGLDAIVSADGDADRPLVADEAGNLLRGDLIGLMTAEFLGARVVVTPETSNSGIEKIGSFEVIRTRVGSPYVIAGMLEALAASKGGVIGFEANGGFLTATSFAPAGKEVSALPTRDCFLPILSVLYMAAKSGKTLSGLANAYRLPVANADRIEGYALERSAALIEHLRSSDDNLSAFLAGIGRVIGKSDIDGLRVFLDNGRTIHFRPSGNAPEMRCYVEAEDKAAARSMLRKGLRLIEAFTLGENDREP